MSEHNGSEGHDVVPLQVDPHVLCLDPRTEPKSHRNEHGEYRIWKWILLVLWNLNMAGWLTLVE